MKWRMSIGGELTKTLSRFYAPSNLPPENSQIIHLFIYDSSHLLVQRGSNTQPTRPTISLEIFQFSSPNT
ncbi:hypothetical protein EYC80_002055 [Monilinia laxa]|uniref:Uncharacterized protein n=1 Tax=Monilinia laxa TaxID=61186 RepID=A0A5N6K6U7_MONLA|nr:hypothetical protein EYC80_002055 [Monilinia laxa]